MKITVYSQALCPPCMALKDWLRQEKIAYTNILTGTLDEAGRKYLREKILAVSKINHPTVPAVKIVNGNHEIWVSNHGESDVTGMIDSIKKILRL